MLWSNRIEAISSSDHSLDLYQNLEKISPFVFLEQAHHSRLQRLYIQCIRALLGSSVAHD